MNDLVLYKSEFFNGIECDIWRNEKTNEIFVTRDQIGRALEYSHPKDAIKNIHDRNKDRFSKFSVSLKLSGTDGKLYETYVYSSKGIYEICRFSRQPKADAFMDWIWNLLEGIRKGEIEILQKQLEEFKPKIEFYNQVISAKNNMTMLQASKILKISGRNKLFKFLREEDILMTKGERYNIPRQQYIDSGYFEVVVKPMLISGKVIDISICLVTPKGLQYILKKLNKKKGLLKQAN